MYLRNLEVIGEASFINCSSLETIYIANSLKKIAKQAFASCISLVSVEIKETRAGCVIETEAFYACTSLKTIVIPYTVSSIGWKAFYECLSLNTVTLPFVGADAGLDKYGYGPDDPTDLTDATIYFNYTTNVIWLFDKGEWKHCEDVKGELGWDYVSGAGMPAVDPDTHETGLGVYIDYETGTIYNNYRQILGTVFEYATTHYLGYIFDGFPIYGSVGTDGPWSGVYKSIKNVCFNGLNGPDRDTIPDEAFNGCRYIETIDTRYGGLLQHGAKTIRSKAFKGCISLTELRFGGYLEYIEKGALQDCSALQSLAIPFIGDGASNQYFGYIFGANSAEDQAYYVPYTLKSVEIIIGQDIPDKAFKNCAHIEDIKLHSKNIGGVISNSTIGAYAFENCRRITRMILPDKTYSIGDGAFRNCINLAYICIPKSLSSLGNNILEGCYDIVIYYEGTESIWNSYVTNNGTIPLGATGATMVYEFDELYKYWE